MGVHHVALATRDLNATHRFCAGACGPESVNAVVAPTDASGTTGPVPPRATPSGG